MLDLLVFVFTNLFWGFVNIFRAAFDPASWLDWSDRTALVRFIYYGGSVEFFFSVIALFLTILVAGLIWRRFLWGVVVGLEGFANVTGRLFAWAGLLMVLQQVMIVFL